MSDTNLSPREIVSELDRHIVGQKDAKRAVAIALRNRWRRQQVDEKLRYEITTKNILMIGPTGMEDMAEQLKGVVGQCGGGRRKSRKLKIREAMKLLVEEEAAGMGNEDEIKAA